MSKHIQKDILSSLCEEILNNNRDHQKIPASDYDKYNVKRGLRNADGSGVLAGLTTVSSVRGYVIDNAERVPVEGHTIYRGYDLNDIVENCYSEGRSCYEEACWLLLFGHLPTESELKKFRDVLGSNRELPEFFAEDMILKAPSPDIMNKLGRSVLALYSYDDDPEDHSLQNQLEQSLKLIAQMPAIMNYSYQAKRRNYDRQSMYLHQIDPKLSTAELILSLIRANQKYTPEEAQLLDLCLCLHAEHGGGNNSTFTTRVLSSSGTDTYAALSAAIGSLKGPRHGGANIKVMQMLECAKAEIKNWNDDGQICDFLRRVLRKETNDGSGLVYGMGHAVYTLSDPRAIILKSHAQKLADNSKYAEEYHLLESIERLSPDLIREAIGIDKPVCANVDMYSGLVYKILQIPNELFTPLFAVARTCGWCAHRIEETITGKRIIRPAYKSVFTKTQSYIPLDER